MSFREAEHAGWTARAGSYDAAMAVVRDQAIPHILAALGDNFGCGSLLCQSARKRLFHAETHSTRRVCQHTMANLFHDLPLAGPDEVFTELLAHPCARIERIVSTGQATPEGALYDQNHDEWVLLLRGGAGLWLEGEAERILHPGDHVFIPAGRRHRVTWTAGDEATVWLAVHLAA
jgi:cupin 2 domain-containing protein